MSNTQQMKSHQKTDHSVPHKTSSLDHFSLGFEYNKTLQEIKREVRLRTV